MNFIYGTNMGELLEGFASNDVIQGFGGNDFIYGYGGADWIYGGVGHDNIKGGDGDDFLYGQSMEDTIEGGNGNDSINGGDHDDQLFGNNGDDSIMGGAGEDYIDGGAGIDTADYSDSNSAVWASLTTGNAKSHAPTTYGVLDGDLDTLVNIESLIGTDYYDWLQGDGGDNTLTGGAGNDRLEGHGGDDDLLGGDDDDQLFGGAGNDLLRHGQGDATVSGGTGHDTLMLDISPTGAGWTIDLEKGIGTQVKPFFKISRPDMRDDISETDARIEEAKTEEIFRDIGEDTGLWPFPDKPAEVETLARLFGAEPVMQAFGDVGGFDFPGFEDKPELEGFDPGSIATGPAIPIQQKWEMTISGIEDVIGSDGNDRIHGNGLDNALHSMGGDDLLDGRGGNDFLYSNKGEATLIGGAGEDRLIASAGSGVAEMTGGADDDTFVFESNPFSDTGHRGTIIDFTDGDLIEVFDYASANPMTFSQTGTFDATGPQARIVQSLGNSAATLEVDSDGDGLADWSVDIVKTDPFHMLGADDILV